MNHFQRTRLFSALLLGNAFLAYAGENSYLMTERAAGRFLDQATFGPTAGTIEQLRRAGVTKWLGGQFATNTSDLPDQPILRSDGKSNNDLRPVQSAFFANALTGQDQLRQRVAFALSEIWVISALDVNPAYATPPYWRILRDNAFGNYRDVIKSVTLSPAMGHYLDMANNNKGNPAKDTAPNENYGRELLQLFTLGLVQLHPDGSIVLDSSGNPVPTYTQAEVSGISSALTGWTYPTKPDATAKNNNPAYYTGQMYAVEANHDTSQKLIFGNISIPAGQTAEQDLESVLDALMAQDTMAPFVCEQLIQHLVTSNPSPAYVERVSQVFLDNGSGVRGDLKAVITAILTDSEARSGDNPDYVTPSNFGHLREPVLFMGNVLRGLNATLGPSSLIGNQSAQMGQNLFYAPSVFSYFSPQNRTENGLLGPEFQIYSTQTAATRADIVGTVLYGALDKSTKINLAPFTRFSGNNSALVDYISQVFLYHGMSKDLQGAALAAANAATSPTKAVQAALYVTLTSSEYQIIH